MNKKKKIISFIILGLGFAIAMTGFVLFLANFQNGIYPGYLLINTLGIIICIVGLLLLRNAYMKAPKKKTITCSCGEKNKVGATYCSKCGRELHKKCETCGNLIAIDDEICPYCYEAAMKSKDNK